MGLKLEGTFSIAAPRSLVWSLLNDPAVLQRTIPGCERLTPAGPNRFEAIIKVGVASVKGTYTGTVVIEDVRAPESYSLVVDGKGSGGFVRGQGRISLAEEGSATALVVSGDATVGGAIAGVGQRLVGSAGKMMLADFFKSLDAEARALVPAPVVAVTWWQRHRFLITASSIGAATAIAAAAIARARPWIAIALMAAAATLLGLAALRRRP